MGFGEDLSIGLDIQDKVELGSNVKKKVEIGVLNILSNVGKEGFIW